MTKRSLRSKQIRAGLAQAATMGRVPGRPQKVTDAEIWAAMTLGTAAGSRAVGLSKAQFIIRRRRIENSIQPPAQDRKS